MHFKKHLFVCTNQRTGGSRPSCGEEFGLQLVAAFKKAIKDRGLNTEIRAQKAGCLDVCEWGPNVVVYPEGIFYMHVTLADVEEIVEEHIVNNRPVERLVNKFRPEDHRKDVV